jgi:hypothetical protein
VKKILHAMQILISVFVIFTIMACGYKPSAKFSRDVVGEKISTDVVISAQDPENTVIVKDAVDAAIVKVFHASLTSRASSQTHLQLSISNPSYSPIQYNSDGYVIGYRTTITLKIIRYHNGLSKSYSAKGTYDFSIQPNAIISDQERFRAIKFSSEKAIKSFLAQVSAEGARVKK